MNDDPWPSDGAVRRRVTGSGERGTATISTIILVPVIVIAMTMGVHAAVAAHARTEARHTAQVVAGLVGRGVLGSADAESSVRQIVGSHTDLVDVDVDVDVDEIGGGVVIVTIRGRTTGLIAGTSSPVTVTGVVAREDWRP